MISYYIKLYHNYHELTPSERQRYTRTDRKVFSPSERFFFEGCLARGGELYMADRKSLYDIVLKYEPAHCLEIGTGGGGGSTFFLAKAFARLGKGKVITLEIDRHGVAFQTYQQLLPGLLPFVEFLTGGDPVLFAPFIEDNGGIVDCVFLDGSDFSEEAVAQYEFFKPFFRPGSILMAHDWDGAKMKLLRPIIEASPEWSIKVLLNRPESLGFIVARYQPN